MEKYSVEIEYIKRVCNNFEFPPFQESCPDELSAENRFAILDLGFPTTMRHVPSSIIKEGDFLIVNDNLNTPRKIINLNDNQVYWMHGDSLLVVNSNLIIYFYVCCVFKQVSYKLSRIVWQEGGEINSAALLREFLKHIQEVEDKYSGIQEMSYWNRIVEDLLGYIE